MCIFIRWIVSQALRLNLPISYELSFQDGRNKKSQSTCRPSDRTVRLKFTEKQTLTKERSQNICFDVFLEVLCTCLSLLIKYGSKNFRQKSTKQLETKHINKHSKRYCSWRHSLFNLEQGNPECRSLLLKGDILHVIHYDIISMLEH